MEKLLTDVHTHSAFSHDSQTPLQEMLKYAQGKGICFYGVSEHFDYDIIFGGNEFGRPIDIDAESYFHEARHLQEDYAGVMNVLVGVEFSYGQKSLAKKAEIDKAYIDCCEKYRPDFVINSIHSIKGLDYFYFSQILHKDFEQKQKVYGAYLSAVRESLDAPYPYDIVGHLGYVTRYSTYDDRRLTLEQFGEQIDDILLTIIQKDKILEINSSNKGGVSPFLPSNEIIKRYYELGGRKVSFGSDAHHTDRILEKRQEVTALLKEIGFTYITVPCKGEHIKVEI